jgi:TetR/AcrR family transcriptional repressor of uid operon
MNVRSHMRTHHASFFERLAEAEDPVEALASLGIDALEAAMVSRTNTLAVEVTAEAIRNPAIRGSFLCNATEAMDVVVAALKRGQERGLVDPALDVEAAGRLVMALGDGLLAHQALDRGLSPERYRPVLQALLRRFLRPAP